MKKIILTVLAVLFVLPAFAQNSTAPQLYFSDTNNMDLKGPVTKVTITPGSEGAYFVYWVKVFAGENTYCAQAIHNTDGNGLQNATALYQSISAGTTAVICLDRKGKISPSAATMNAEIALEKRLNP